jgi:hypothetical protein
VKKLALAFVAASCVLFGLGHVASAQYGGSATVTPSTVVGGGPYSVTYRNCLAGDTITFTQAQSTPSTVTVPCVGSVVTLTGSLLGVLLPQQAALGTATANFTAAPTAPGNYTGTAVGLAGRSPSITFSFTIPGQATTTTTPVVTTVPATTPGGGLPATGSDGIGTTTSIAIGLLVVGLGLFVVAQVRRRQTPSPA